MSQKETDVDLHYSQVIRRKIPIRIKNVENPRGLGTVIHPNSDLDLSEAREILLSESASLDKLDYLQLIDQGHKKLPTAVTIKERIIVLNIHSNRKSVSHGFLAGIFGMLDSYGVVVDLISTSEVHISMAIEDTHEKKLMDRLVRDLEKYGTVSLGPPPLHTSPAECNGFRLKLGYPGARDGYSVARWTTEEYDWVGWTHVHITWAGECQHRDD